MTDVPAVLDLALRRARQGRDLALKGGCDPDELARLLGPARAFLADVAELVKAGWPGLPRRTALRVLGTAHQVEATLTDLVERFGGGSATQ
jgi:hypothetical protein